MLIIQILDFFYGGEVEGSFRIKQEMKDICVFDSFNSQNYTNLFKNSELFQNTQMLFISCFYFFYIEISEHYTANIMSFVKYGKVK